MSLSRSKKALVNTACEIALEIVTAVCALILPRLILSHFGSAYNGITHSISQFISCIAILKSGIGSVTRAALYKPLALSDYDAVSVVAKTTESFMRKIALLFSGGLLIFAIVFPFTIPEFDWLFTASLVIILSVSTIAQYYFGMTYQMILQADQKNYVISLVTIGSTILNTVVSAILINAGCTIHTVKIGSALVFIFPPLFYYAFVKQKYNLNSHVKPDNTLISQRWDAFAHQIANFINTNTDVMLITLVLGVTEVSVYSIYYMVSLMVLKAVMAFTSGTTAAFGNIIAKGEEKTLVERFRQYEFLIFAIAIFLSSVMCVMYIPFVRLYTANITDADYIRPVFALLISISTFLNCVKTPYQQLVYAAGKFKQTKKAAIIEAAINICITFPLLFVLGIYGAIIGTICAVSYWAIWYSIFISKEITRTNNSFWINLLFAGIAFSGTIGLTFWYRQEWINNYYSWVLFAAITTLIAGAVVTALSLLIFKKETIALIKTLMEIISRKTSAKKQLS